MKTAFIVLFSFALLLFMADFVLASPVENDWFTCDSTLYSAGNLSNQLAFTNGAYNTTFAKVGIGDCQFNAGYATNFSTSIKYENADVNRAVMFWWYEENAAAYITGNGYYFTYGDNNVKWLGAASGGTYGRNLTYVRAGNDQLMYGNTTFKQWTHIAIIYDATEHNLSLYINGVLKSKNATVATTFTKTTGQVTLGAEKYSTSYYGSVTGHIDDFRWYENQPLPSQQDILNDYNNSNGCSIALANCTLPATDTSEPKVVLINLTSQSPPQNCSATFNTTCGNTTATPFTVYVTTNKAASGVSVCPFINYTYVAMLAQPTCINATGSGTGWSITYPAKLLNVTGKISFFVAANDSSNGNYTQSYDGNNTFSLFINDLPPIIRVNMPNATIDGQSWQNFSWIAMSATSTNLSCNVTIDSITKAAFIQTSNNTITNVTNSSITNGIHWWNASCTNGAKIGYSGTANFTSFLNPPTMQSWSVSPTNGTAWSNTNISFGSTWNSSATFGTNTTINSTLYSGNVSIPLKAGTWWYNFTSRDQYGNLNTSNTYSYVVAKLTSIINVTHNPLVANFTSNVTTSCINQSGVALLSLYKNGTLVTTSTTNATIITTASGNWNYTCVSQDNENITGTSQEADLHITPVPMWINIAVNGSYWYSSGSGGGYNITIPWNTLMLIGCYQNCTGIEEASNYTMQVDGNYRGSGAGSTCHGTGSSFTENFTTLGNFNYTCVAIQSYPSSNYSQAQSSIYIKVTNVKPPTITLNYPINSTSTTNSWMNFSWNASDDDTNNLNCTLVLDSVAYPNLYDAGGIIINKTINAISKETHYWNVSCQDASYNNGVSPTRFFAIPSLNDTTPYANTGTYSEYNEAHNKSQPFTGTESIPHGFNITVTSTIMIINITLTNANCSQTRAYINDSNDNQLTWTTNRVGNTFIFDTPYKLDAGQYYYILWDSNGSNYNETYNNAGWPGAITGTNIIWNQPVTHGIGGWFIESGTDCIKSINEAINSTTNSITYNWPQKTNFTNDASDDNIVFSIVLAMNSTNQTATCAGTHCSYNYSSLGAGKYWYNWTLIDVFGTRQLTSTNYIIINRANPSLNLTINGSTTTQSIVMNTSFQVMCVDNNVESPSLLIPAYRDGIQLGNITGYTLNLTDLLPIGGSYNYSCQANNQNYTGWSNSVIINSINNIPPTITLLWPSNNSSFSRTYANFTWMTISPYSTGMNCSLTLNSTAYSNQTAINNTVINRTISITDGIYHWNATCWDSSGLSASSSTYNFSNDNTAPVISNYVVTPNSPLPYQSTNIVIFTVTTYDISMVKANITLNGKHYPMTAISKTDGFTNWQAQIPNLNISTYLVNVTACDDRGYCSRQNETSYQVLLFTLDNCANNTFFIINATSVLSTNLSYINTTSFIYFITLFSDSNSSYVFNFTNTWHWALCSNVNASMYVTGMIVYQDTKAYFAQQQFVFNNATFKTDRENKVILYVTPATSMTTITIVDTKDVPQEGATIYAQTYPLNSLTYVTVASSVTGLDGRVGIVLVPYIVPYKYVVYDSQGRLRLETTPSYVTSTSFTLTLWDIVGTQDNWNTVNGAQCTVFYNNDTKNARFDWGINTGQSITGCLYVKKFSGVQDQTINVTCAYTNSGSAIIPLDYSTGTYSLIGTLMFGDGMTQPTSLEQFACGQPVILEEQSKLVSYGSFTIMLALLIFCVMAGIGIWNPIAGIVLGLFALVICWVTGIYAIGLLYLVGLIAIGGIVIYRIKMGGY